MRYITISATYFLTAIFLFTGIDKALHYRGFINALGSYAIVPTGMARYLALPIILSEIWIACGLLIRPWRKMAALIGAGFLSAFTVALLFNYIYAPEAVCGCWFSITLGTASITHILQNVTLFGLALLVWSDTQPKKEFFPHVPESARPSTVPNP